MITTGNDLITTSWKNNSTNITLEKQYTHKLKELDSDFKVTEQRTYLSYVALTLAVIRLSWQQHNPQVKCPFTYTFWLWIMHLSHEISSVVAR